MKTLVASVLLRVLLLGVGIISLRAQTYSIDSFTVVGGSGTVSGGAYQLSGTVGQPDASLALSGGDFSLTGGFWSIDLLGGAAAAAFDKNLIVNPGAEAGPGSGSGNDIVAAPNWTVAPARVNGTNNFTVVAYNSEFTSFAHFLPTAPEFGTNFFSGGPATRTDSINPFASATQTIDPSALASEIDAGTVTAELSGYFGGYSGDTRTTLTATYLDAGGSRLGDLTVGNVSLADRTNRTVLLFRGANNVVPSGTRQIRVALAMTNPTAAYYNDGFADNLSLVLRRSGSASTVIFDNTLGIDNGGFDVTEAFWMASKFCLGSQPFALNSVSLLLNSQDFSGAAGPPASVRLQIYSNDPVRGRPLANTGIIMNLFGRTNPVTLLRGLELVTWTPTTPFTLNPNTCYWAVLSREGGGNIGQIASVTRPIGAAASFGVSRSGDAGATWQPADDSFNLKMLIRGSGISNPALIPELGAGALTAIPGGTGNFTTLSEAPSLNGNDLVFFGGGSGGQQGIYSTLRGSTQTPTRVVDLNTPVPSGAGNFLSFGTEAGIIIVGGNVLFEGRGSGSQEGIYLSSRTQATQPIRLADTSTTIPGGIGTFTGFPNALGFSGSEVAFVGNGSAGQQGLYTVAVLSPPQVGSPLRLADTATPIPGGSGNFTAFPSGPAVDQGEVAFIGNGSGAQQGLYTVAVLSPPQVGSPLKIADTTTAIPGGSGNFTAFGSDQAHPVDPAMSGDRLAFVGSGSGGQQGVYTVAVLSPPQVGSPARVADTATAIPNGSGNFSSFSAVSVSGTDTAFLGHGAGGQTGIYDMTGGQLRKVISVGESIQGKTITGLNFARAGLFGDPVAFQATFSDGSQGIFTIDVTPPSSEIRITALEKVGNDLRLSFTSTPGQTYAIQSRADLSSGVWTTISGPTLSSGATVQISLPNGLSQAQQFYRVQTAP